MKIRLNNLNFGQRLILLYKRKGIDVHKNHKWAQTVALSLFEENLLDYSDYSEKTDDYGKDKTEVKTRDNIATVLRRHLKYTDSVPDARWLSVYCKFFDCSADYLLGFIDKPTHDIESIHAMTGFTNDSIEKLKNTIALHPYFPVVISTLLEHHNCEYFLSLLQTRFSSSAWPNKQDEFIECKIYDKDACINANGLLDSLISNHLIQDMPELSKAYINNIRLRANEFIRVQK